MSEIDTGGHDEMWEDDERFLRRSDMTLRDWFAGQAMAGMAAYSGTSGVSYGPGDISGRAYEIADAMLAARRR